MLQNTTENNVWNEIGRDSFDFEHSMDVLHRKQTGSYYTDLELTLAMMKEMVDSLSVEDKAALYTKSFLEPCVGTGNFVFAYLRVCKELGFSSAQYKELIDNIYVCDINKGALEVYKKNLTQIAKTYFDIDIEPGYFDSHIGSGLMIDVDEEKTRYIQIADVFSQDIVKGGFDFVVTNPPYKNLKAERSHYQSDDLYDRDRNKYAAIGKLASKLFPNSSVGTLNLYKMFVEEIMDKYLANNGVASLLIPASILSDKTCSKLRTHLLDISSLKSVRIISEESTYVDASQALCAMLFHKGGPTENIYVDGSFSGDITTGTMVSVDDIIDQSTGNAILVLEKEEYAIRHKMKEHPIIKDIAYIDNMRGELDMTLNKGSIVVDETPYRLYRGRHVGYYCMNDVPEVEYVKADFVEYTAKKKYVLGERLACQQIVNMAKKRRISFVVIPENSVLANSCNFISVSDNEDGVDLFFLMGILNSSLIDWYFKLTSSNNHINNYEIDSFPIPVSFAKKEDISNKVQEYIQTKDELLLDEIDQLVYEAYGIKKSRKTDVGQPVKSVITDSESAFSQFVNDLTLLGVKLTEDDYHALADGSVTIAEMLEKNQITLPQFDRKVAESIVLKYKKLMAGEILNHTTFKLSDLDLEMIKPVPQGGSWKDIPLETVRKSKRLERISQTGGRTTLYGRIDYSKPSYTITTYFNRPGNGTYVHPVHERVLSVREAARFQCFPDEYLFCGNKTDMLKQVGNAVPVLLAYNIGKAIIEKTGCKTSVDLFSGAGGMTYGFKRAGIRAVIANDIVEPACVTLRVNNPEIPVLCGDITVEETKKAIISAGTAANADIICGGPPCQGFSLAGYRMKDDPRNQLFRHFVDIVSSVNPKVIVFENVEGILSYQGGETYRNIIELFSELGYYTEGRKLMANHYGVPQRRKRVIILCTRKDLGVLPSDIFPAPITPNPDKQITAYDTIFDLENVPCEEHAKYNSNYESSILQFLKGTSAADDYLESVTDRRGVISSADDDSADEEDDDCTENGAKNNTKDVKPAKEPYHQLTLFDMI